MTRKSTVLLLTLYVAALGARLADPRDMSFPMRLDFTPHEVERRTLSNGIEVFFIEDHELPLVDVTVSVRAGERRVETPKAGLAEILAYVIVEGGSRTCSRRVFQDSLEKLGASFYARTGAENSSFNLHLLASHVDALLPLAASAVREPALPEEDIVINKKQYLASYLGRNQEPSSVAGRVFSKLIYGSRSPSAREVTPQTLARINRGELQKFHRANFRPTLAMIGVAGDFDPTLMLELLERCFGSWQEPASQPSEELPLVDASAAPGVYLVQWPGAVQSDIRMGYLGLRRDDPRYPASRILSEIYGASRFSRLYYEIRDKRGYAYVASGYVSSGFETPGLFSGVTMTRSQNTLETVDIMLGVVKSLKTEGITADELKLAKSSWLAAFPSYYAESNEVLLDRMNYAAHGYPVDFWDKMPGRVEPLTREEVSDFARDFLKPESLIFLVVGDTAAFDGSLSRFGEVHVLDKEVW